MTNLYSVLHEKFSTANDFILSSEGKSLASYTDLEKRSAQYANWLLCLGLKQGDRVIVQVEKSVEALYLYFACLRAGLIYLPLNTAYQKHELKYFVENARPTLIVCSPDKEEIYRSFFTGAIAHLDAQGEGTASASTCEESDQFETLSSDKDDVAAILYTSGTTGRPKGAMISHGNLSDNAVTLHRAWGWKTGDLLLHSLPIFHVHGLFVATHLAVLNGSPMIYLPKFDPAEVTEMLPHSTVYMGVPTHYVRLLANPAFDSKSCRNMRLFTSGSAPLLPQTFTTFQERTGHTIVERYGMTETGMNTSNPVNGRQKPGTVGKPLAGVTCKIVDDKGRPLPINETGHLLVKGGNVFQGYWQMPDKTLTEFTDDGFFITGDLATCDKDGYISIVGRNKDMIITGGLNVYPKEIEEQIDLLEEVEESAVIGIAHEDFGEAVVAVIVLKPAASLDSQTVIDYMKSQLANFKVPKQVHFIESLPRNTMGKVQKNLLRETFTEG